MIQEHRLLTTVGYCRLRNRVLIDSRRIEPCYRNAAAWRAVTSCISKCNHVVQHHQSGKSSRKQGVVLIKQSSIEGRERVLSDLKSL
jgi:hypothetical protein